MERKIKKMFDEVMEKLRRTDEMERGDYKNITHRLYRKDWAEVEFNFKAFDFDSLQGEKSYARLYGLADNEHPSLNTWEKSFEAIRTSLEKWSGGAIVIDLERMRFGQIIVRCKEDFDTKNSSSGFSIEDMISIVVYFLDQELKKM